MKFFLVEVPANAVSCREDDGGMNQRSSALVEFFSGTTGGDRWLQHSHHPREFAVLGLVVLKIGYPQVQTFLVSHATHCNVQVGVRTSWKPHKKDNFIIRFRSFWC